MARNDKRSMQTRMCICTEKDREGAKELCINLSTNTYFCGFIFKEQLNVYNLLKQFRVDITIFFRFCCCCCRYYSFDLTTRRGYYSVCLNHSAFFFTLVVKFVCSKDTYMCSHIHTQSAHQITHNNNFRVQRESLLFISFVKIYPLTIRSFVCVSFAMYLLNDCSTIKRVSRIAQTYLFFIISFAWLQWLDIIKRLFEAKKIHKAENILFAYTNSAISFGWFEEEEEEKQRQKQVRKWEYSYKRIRELIQNCLHFANIFHLFCLILLSFLFLARARDISGRSTCHFSVWDCCSCCRSRYFIKKILLFYPIESNRFCK